MLVQAHSRREYSRREFGGSEAVQKRRQVEPLCEDLLVARNGSQQTRAVTTFTKTDLEDFLKEKNAEVLLEELAGEQRSLKVKEERCKERKKLKAGNMALTRDEADRNAEALLEKLASEEKSLKCKKERHKELKNSKLGIWLGFAKGRLGLAKGRLGLSRGRLGLGRGRLGFW